MKRILTALMAFSAMSMVPVLAQAEEVDVDELVLLPGQGELRDRGDRQNRQLDRLKPGGGLFMTFDADTNGSVSPDEIERGIPLAFVSADANADGYLTALEQQDWAANLPTRDDSLANPSRFDPNLDRRVDLEEFMTVINKLGLDYADELTGEIILADLKATIEPEERRGLFAGNGGNRDRGNPGRSNGQQRQ